MIPNAIELFAGCGGLSTGLLDAGIQVRLGTDYYAPAVRTFQYNHQYRGVQSLVADIRTIDGSTLLSQAGLQLGQLHLLAGGPPCQPFSIIGKRQGLNDPRGDLVLEYVRIVRETVPEVFVFENVANLVSVADGRILAMLLERMAEVGYATAHAVLNAADYGVGQTRKRLIIIGVRGNTPIAFPPLTTHGRRILLGETPHVTCKDILGDLPDVVEKESHLIPNHEPTQHGPSMLAAFRQLLPGARDPKSHHDRLHPDRPSFTLRAGSGNFSPLRPVHYQYDRVVTVRESARIQGFSDDFIWPHDMPRLQQYRQVGNAVPPPLARIIGAHIAGQLGWQTDREQTKGDLSRREILTIPSIEEQARKRHKLIRGASVGKINTNWWQQDMQD